jgi:hypothetical protein
MSNVSLVKGRGAITVDVDWNGDIVWVIEGSTSLAVGVEMCRVALCSSVKELLQRAAGGRH